jgi:hypothetical protein
MTSRFWRSSLLATCVVVGPLARPEPASAQTATSAPASSASAACFPACRAGFVCARGRCVSPCNPPCDAGDVCTAAGECVDAATAAAAARAHPPPPVNDDPSGCRAASQRASTLRKDGKLAAARTELATCSNATCPSDTRKDCAHRLTEVEAATPTVVFGFKDADGNDLSAVKTTVDGRSLADSAEGTALSLDPGDHGFVFETAGLPRVDKHFVLREGERGRTETVVFAAPAAPPPQPGTPASADNADDVPPGRDVAKPAAERPSTGDTTKRTIGFVVGAVGLGAGILAIYEEVVAQGRNSDANNAAANSSPDVQATAGPIHDQAVEAQTYALVSGGAALVGVGVGLYLVLTSLDRTPPTAPAPATNASGWRISPVMSPRVSGLWLERTF